MWLLLDLVLAVLASGFVVVPLLREERGGESEDSGAGDRIALLEEQKLGLLKELKEMEYDFRAGKLSESDYAELADRYKKSAAQVLGEIDRLRAADSGEGAGPGTERSAKGSAGGGKIARRRRGGGAQKRFCAGCGTKIAAEAKFCGSCGRSLA